MPVIATAADGRPLMLGRNRPLTFPRRLLFSDYVRRAALPPLPLQTDYWRKAVPALEQVYLNDQLGDCVIAGIAHLEGVFTGNNGDDPAVVFANHRIQKLYGAIGDYVIGDPATDRGCDEITALNYWQAHGAMPDQPDAHKIAGWISLDGSKPDDLKTAIYLFENAFFGIELPDEWLRNIQPEMTLDVAGEPNPNNGHCVVGVDYLPDGRIVISTWGMRVYMTPAAVAAYATTRGQGELYTVLSPNAVNRATQKAPNGFDWTALKANLASLGAAA